MQKYIGLPSVNAAHAAHYQCLCRNIMSTVPNAVLFYLATNYSAYLGLMDCGQELKAVKRIQSDLLDRGIHATEFDVVGALRLLLHSGILDFNAPAARCGTITNTGSIFFLGSQVLVAICNALFAMWGKHGQ